MTPKQFEEIENDIKKLKKYNTYRRLRHGMSILSMLTIAGGVALPGAELLVKANHKDGEKTEQIHKVEVGDDSEFNFKIIENNNKNENLKFPNVKSLTGEEEATLIQDLVAAQAVKHLTSQSDAITITSVDGKDKEGPGGYNQLDKKGPEELRGGTYITANNVRTISYRFSDNVWLEVFNDADGVRTWALVVTGAENKARATEEIPYVNGELSLYFTQGKDNNNSYSQVKINIDGAGVYEIGKGTGNTGIQSVYVSDNTFKPDGKNHVRVTKRGAVTVNYHNLYATNDKTTANGRSYGFTDYSDGTTTWVNGETHTVFDGLATTGFEHEGYTFAHWSDGTDKAQPINGTLKLTNYRDAGSIDLYAEWNTQTGAEFVITAPLNDELTVGTAAEFAQDIVDNANATLSSTHNLAPMSYTLKNDPIVVDGEVIVTIDSPKKLQVNTYDQHSDNVELISPAEKLGEVLESYGLASDTQLWTTNGGGEYGENVKFAKVLNDTITTVTSSEGNEYKHGGVITFNMTLSSADLGGEIDDTSGDEIDTPTPGDIVKGKFEKLANLNQLDRHFTGLFTSNGGQDGVVYVNSAGTLQYEELEYDFAGSNQSHRILKVTNISEETQIVYIASGQQRESNNVFKIVRLEIAPGATAEVTHENWQLDLGNADRHFIFNSVHFEGLEELFESGETRAGSNTLQFVHMTIG